MRHSESRGAVPPPSGRRIPAIASGKPAKPEDRPNARDLLASVNSASSGASTSWLAFLGTMAYLAVTLSGITHVDLLLDRETTLPFVGFKVPLTAFFVAAPLAFVLVHFGLLLQHVVLSRKLRAFEERLWKENPTRNRREQPIRDELHSYSFTQSVSGMPKGAAVDMALRLVMSLTLVVFPLLLLTFFQIGFLPYHSEPITWWHRGMLVADVTVIVVLTRYLARRDRSTKVRLTDWWHGRSALRARLTTWCRRKLSLACWALRRVNLQVRGQDYGPVVSRIVRPVLKALCDGGTFVVRACAYVLSPSRFVIGVLMLFSLCVATLPDEYLDRLTASFAYTWVPHLSEPLPYCRSSAETAHGNSGKSEGINVEAQNSGQRRMPWTSGKRATLKPKSCPPVTPSTRRAVYLTAYLFEREVNTVTGKSEGVLGWSRNLIVTDKTPFHETTRPTLRGRDLRYATLDRSDFKGSDFYGAELGGARLVRSDLSTSSLHAASLQGADLRWAKLQSADLSYANLQGANLSGASLQGARFIWAGLQGSDLSGAKLLGGDLHNADLQGTDLSMADLRGANLSWAGLQAVNLSGANLRGAVLTHAGLQGANLGGRMGFGANLHGAYLVHAALQGATLQRTELKGADFRGARLWRNGAPSDTGRLTANKTMALVWFQVDIRPLDEAERKRLRDVVEKLETLKERMERDRLPGRERVGHAVRSVATIVQWLLNTEIDERLGPEGNLRTWCKWAGQSPPEPGLLSTYLGSLACEDETERGHLAQSLVRRILSEAATRPYRIAPDDFLRAFNGCSAFERVPADLRNQLERAAKQSKENKELVKRSKVAALVACNSFAATPQLVRWSVARALREQQTAFLGVLRTCPALASVPGDLSALLSLASIRERRSGVSEVGPPIRYKIPRSCVPLADGAPVSHPVGRP